MCIYLLGINIVEDKKKGNVNGRTTTSRFEIGIKQTRVGYPYPSLELSFLFYDLNTYISCQAEGS
jgi:hypothetical protein